MSINQLNKPLKSLLTFTSFLFVFSLWAQTSISGLQYGGQNVNQAYITVTPPKGKPTQITAQVGQQFQSGTLFQVPGSTVVFLTANGNSQRLGPGAKHQVVASAQGENHRTFFGKVKHWVKNKMNFYKASGPNKKYQGAVQGTEFTVEAVGHNVKFQTTEGSVSIQRKVPLNIYEDASVKRKKEREIYTIKTTYVNAGDPEAYYDYESNETADFYSYREAIEVYKNRLDEGYYNGADPYYLADEYSLLGSLYMDSGNAASAIDPFIKALNLWYDIDPYDPFIYENYLDLAEAYYLAGYTKEGVKNWDIAVGIIDREYKFNLDEYNYFYDIGDFNTAWGFGIDLVEMYEALGLAYEIRYSLGGKIDEFYQNPDYWYGQADDLNSILDKF